MDQRSAVRRYGGYLGVLAGVFAALQVLISTTAALADAGNLTGAQLGLSSGTAAPQYLFDPLLPPVVASYLAMMVTGAIMLYLAHQAGWLAASVSGRREAGMSAGGRVAVVSGAIWIVLSVLVVLRTHADGTVTGLFTSNPAGPLQPVELPGLLIQELAAGLIGWGLGSLMGQMGAAGAARTAIPPAAPWRRPVDSRQGPQYGMDPTSTWPTTPPSTPSPSNGAPYGAWPEASAPTGPRQAYLDGGAPMAN